MHKFLAALPPLFGRLLVSSIFLWSGWGKVMHPGGAASRIAARGLPLARPAAIAAGLFELIVGGALLLGLKTRSAAAVAFLFVVAATWLFHWNAALVGDSGQMVHVMKNAAVGGGLLLLVAHGPGPGSLDRG